MQQPSLAKSKETSPSFGRNVTLTIRYSLKNHYPKLLHGSLLCLMVKLQTKVMVVGDYYGVASRMSEARIKRCCPIFHLNCTNDYFLGWWKNTISYNLFIRINFYFWLIRKTWVEWILHKIMITYDYIIITMMGYEHNKKKIEDERVCVWSHMKHWLCYFYYYYYM